MNRRFYALMSVFFMLLFLFCVEEFSVHSFINRASTNMLISRQNMAGYPNKVILVIIDSLRYDYLSKIPFFQEIDRKYPSRSFITKCKVGNPTMTTQRVESLMTGSEIFSSANIFKSFFASKLQTDNIISQLNSQNKTSIIFGDDTWAKLFEFTAEKTCVNTFNVHDYDSCDKLIYENMIVRMKEATYDFMVAHFLALDHIGHSKGKISDDLMLEKMKSISKFLQEVAQKMDNQTILFVTGDHGMRDDGNHGGSSQQQTETIMFGYNKQTQFLKPKKPRIVEQSDLTATMSIYLGINLPSNSVGIPFSEALPANLSNQAKLQLLTNLVGQIRQIFRQYNLQVKYVDSINKQEVHQQKIQSLLEEVRQHKNKLQFLKYSSQNTTILIVILFCLTCISALVLFNIHKQIRTRLLIDLSLCSSLVYNLNIGLLSFTLFGVFFSWGLTKRLSQILLITIIVSLVISYSYSRLNNEDNLKKMLIIIWIILALCQIEPEKVGQYSKNPLSMNDVHEILQKTLSKILLYCLLIYRIWSLMGKINKSRQTFIFCFMAFLSTVQFMSSCYKTPIYFLRVAIIIFPIIIQLYYAQHKESRSKHGSILNLSVIMLMFLGDFGAIILLCCIQITKIAIQLNISPVFLSFFNEVLWWFMGNRFQYSGIDVVKSYIFSENYSPFMNGFSMLLYIISPQLTLFILMNIMRYRNEKQTFQIVSEEQIYETSKSTSLQYACDKQGILLGNTQFIIIPLLGLLSCAWNVFYNNQKILFTVLYIPMFLFCIIKLISAFCMVTFANFLIARKQKGPTKLRL